jgi:ATP-dependent Lon protease
MRRAPINIRTKRAMSPSDESSGEDLGSEDSYSDGDFEDEYEDEEDEEEEEEDGEWLPNMPPGTMVVVLTMPRENEVDCEGECEEESSPATGANAMAIGSRTSPRKRSQSQTSPTAGSPRAKNPKFSDYSTAEQAFYKGLSREEKARICELEGTIQVQNDVVRPLRFRVLQSQLSPQHMSMCMAKVNALSRMDPSTGEYNKLTTWVEQLCKIPIGIYKGLSIVPTFSSTTTTATPPPTPTEIAAFLADTMRILDETVYGHVQAKDQLIRWLAQWIMDPGAKGCVLGLHGPAGVGKTSLVQGLCRALQLPFASISLGGAHDASYLDGHSITYEGSTWGRIASVLMESRCMNPILVYEEAEKQAHSRSDEITSLLIHMTDPAQNANFSDKYFKDIPLDISRCIQIFTMNDPDALSPILRDRMIMIEVAPYATKDKLHIAAAHLVPSLLRQFHMSPGDITFPEETVKAVISAVDDEAGVRTLRRGLECIVSNINLGRLVPPGTLGVDTYALPVTVTEKTAKTILERAKMEKKKMGESFLHLYT